MLEIIQRAVASGKKTLSEYESSLVIKSADVEVAPSFLARTRDEACQMAEKLGFPVVMKGCSAELAHKTEAGMVIEFYSVDGRLLYEIRGVALEIESQFREYRWLPGSSGPRTRDAYSEVSAEYPLRKHVYLSAGGGGFFRTMGNEGFKPQAELRLIARI